MAEDIKLNYVTSEFRVRVEFCKAHTTNQKKIPQDIMERAISKMEKEKLNRRIESFQVFAQQFQDLWTLFRKQEIPAETSVRLTVAAGAPHLPGIKIVVDGTGKTLGRLTILATDEVVQNWDIHAFQRVVIHKLREFGVKEHVDPSYVHWLLLKAKAGRKIANEAVYKTPPSVANSKGLMLLKRSGYLMAVFTNVRPFKSEETITKLIMSLNKQLAAIEYASGGNYSLMKENITSRIRSAHRGPEFYGFGLPLVLLAAVNEDELQVPKIKAPIQIKPRSVTQPKRSRTFGTAQGQQPPNSPQRTSQRTPQMRATTGQKGAGPDKEQQQSKDAEAPTVSAAPAAHPLAEFIKVELDAKELTATVSSFVNAVYDSEKVKIDVDQVEKLLKSQQITFGCTTEIKEALEVAINKKTDLTGTVLAKGKPPLPPSEPTVINLYFGEDPELAKPFVDELNAEMGEQEGLKKAKTYIKNGEVFAVASYAKGGESGKTVKGKPIKPPNPQEFAVEYNKDRVGTKDGLRFFAKLDGYPEISGTRIMFKRKLVISGNVNATTDPINYDGSCTVEGIVEKGAFISVTGDLHVGEIIEGGYIKVGKNLFVEGIRSNNEATVLVGGNVKASFIEYTEVTCLGNVKADSIVNSAIFATNMRVKGSLIGGSVVCWNKLVCENLGTGAGYATNIKAGVDPKIYKMIGRRRRRLEKIEDFIKVSRSQISSLGARKGLNLKEKKETNEIKNKLKASISKARALIEKCQAHLTKVEELDCFNLKGRIRVNGALYSSCTVQICGKTVQILNDVNSVIITSKKINGSYLCSLSDYAKGGHGKAEEEEEEDDDTDSKDTEDEDQAS